MKAVVVKITGKYAFLLLENGRFIKVANKSGMKEGSKVIFNSFMHNKISKAFNIAVCIAAFAFALLFLLYYMRILLLH